MTKYEVMKEKVDKLEDTIHKQSVIFTDMVIMFTLLLEKKIINMDELQERRNQLQEGIADEKGKEASSDNDGSKESTEGHTVQPEDTESDESSS